MKPKRVKIALARGHWPPVTSEAIRSRLDFHLCAPITCVKLQGRHPINKEQFLCITSQRNGTVYSENDPEGSNALNFLPQSRRDTFVLRESLRWELIFTCTATRAEFFYSFRL